MMSTTPYSLSRVISPRQSQQGFTLIELMISMVIGLLLLLAVTTLFVNINRNNNEFAKTNILIENGRFAVQLLESDLIHAGFWGGHIPDFDNLTNTDAPQLASVPPIPPSSVGGSVPTAIPDPCLAYSIADWNFEHKANLLGISVQTYDAALLAVDTTCSLTLPNILANTDMLAIRHANTCVPGEANCEADIAGKLYFQKSNCTFDSDPYVLSTAAADYTLRNRDCTAAAGTGTVADRRKFISNIYYIRDYAVTAGDGIPTLMRSEFDLSGGTLAHQAAVPMIEGIEGFQVELGIDSLSKTGAAINYGATIAWTDNYNKTTPTNRGDGAADDDDGDGIADADDTDGNAFIRCTAADPCTTEQLMNVVAVKLHVLARALEPTTGYTDTKTYALGTTTLGPFNDQFKRHLFSTTVRLQNISTRRETP